MWQKMSGQLAVPSMDKRKVDMAISSTTLPDKIHEKPSKDKPVCGEPRLQLHADGHMMDDQRPSEVRNLLVRIRLRMSGKDACQLNTCNSISWCASMFMPCMHGFERVLV